MTSIRKPGRDTAPAEVVQPHDRDTRAGAAEVAAEIAAARNAFPPLVLRACNDDPWQTFTPGEAP